MSDVDYRDEHRKALEHIERLEAALAAMKASRDAVLVVLHAAERDRDEARALLGELDDLLASNRPSDEVIRDGLKLTSRAALATPEGKAEDETP